MLGPGHKLSEEVSPPFARSRAGDFLFCGAAGVFTVIASMMLGGTTVEVGGIILILFMGAIGLRFYTLRDAVPVKAGVNVTEDELETLRRLRAVLAALPQPVMLLDAASNVEMFNPACAKSFGHDVEGKHISSLIRSPTALEVLRQAREAGAPIEGELASTGEIERTTLFYAAPTEVDDGIRDQRMIIMLRDRTEYKKLERTRTDFVANASHELRTPLTSMAGFIETLQGHAKDDPEVQERFLRIMAGQAERMLRLVEDLIGLSTIELNEARPPEEVVDLAGIAIGVCENLSPVTKKLGATLDWSNATPDIAPIVMGDRHELFRLLQNLCDNALKYGGSDGADGVRVEMVIGSGAVPTLSGAQRTGPSASQIAARAGIDVADIVWVMVRDHGEGIDPNDLPRLTERFYRVSPEISRSKGGTGLGLAIVKHILQRHQGGLQIESLAGKGSVFTCIFPAHN